MIDEKRYSQYNQTFTALKEEINTGNNKFRPQKIGEKVQLLAGVDGGEYAISVVSDDFDIELFSTTLIRLKKIEAKNNKAALIFSLTDDELLSIFISFCIDLENVINSDKNVSIIEIYNRYLYWQKMFKPDSNSISESKIKGLISELYLLDNLMIPKYGISEAIKGWMGSDRSHKDFAYEDGMWYEAKAINVGKVTVKISSIEQLQSETEGLLILSELEKTSRQNHQGIRLYEMLNRIMDKIELEDIQMLFYEKIYSLGISLDVFSDPDHQANSYRYLIQNTTCYKVDDNFPRLARLTLPHAIGLVSYELIIAELENNRVDFY